MYNIFLIINSNDTYNRGLKTLYGNFCTVIDWYNDMSARTTYLQLGYPNVGVLPCMVNMDTKQVIQNVTDFNSALVEIDAVIK